MGRESDAVFSREDLCGAEILVLLRSPSVCYADVVDRTVTPEIQNDFRC
jgi:hypothetical protein